MSDIEREQLPVNSTVIRASELFREHPPATAMVEVSALIDPAMMVEVEVEAVVG